MAFSVFQQAGTLVPEEVVYILEEEPGNHPVVEAGTPVVEAGTPVVEAGTPVVKADIPEVEAAGTPALEVAVAPEVVGAGIQLLEVTQPGTELVDKFLEALGEPAAGSDRRFHSLPSSYSSSR